MSFDLFNFSMYILSGAGVGLLIGLTGVGGGSLMTPLLIMFNIPQHIAIGTDLLYAALTKSNGVLIHHKRGNIHWRIVFAMAAGSIPAALITTLCIFYFFDNPDSYKGILTSTLGVMLIITALVLMFRKRLQNLSSSLSEKTSPPLVHQHRFKTTMIAGFILGVLVTLSSVGAGAFGTAILMVLFTRLPAMHIIGTDLAHAVPLTFVAGMGHFLLLDNVDFMLLTGLLIGSIPAVSLGAKIGARLPERFMYNLLAVILLILGSRFVFF